MIAAQYSLPASSSQCITGGIIGIALFEGAKGINTRLLALTAMSWIWTLLVMGLGTALIFSQGVYTPNRFQTVMYSSTYKTSYISLCTEHYYCTTDYFLKDCKLRNNTALNVPEYFQGTCTSCKAHALSNCKTNQYLKGCNGLDAACTNCSSSAFPADSPMPKCAKGQYLSGCPGTCVP